MSKIVRSNDKLNEILNTGELAQYGGFKNYIINGGFDVWQRGTSFTNVPASHEYTADRWEMTSVASVFTATKVYNGTFVGRVDDSSDANSIFFSNMLETQDSAVLAGKQVTLSFKLKNS